MGSCSMSCWPRVGMYRCSDGSQASRDARTAIAVSMLCKTGPALCPGSLGPIPHASDWGDSKQSSGGAFRLSCRCLGEFDLTTSLFFGDALQQWAVAEALCIVSVVIA